MAAAPRTLEEALTRLEPMALSRGAFVATDGTVDLRFVVERGAVELELDGLKEPPAPHDVALVQRLLVDVVFWDAPALDVVPLPGRAGEKARIRIERPDLAREICRGAIEEARRLEPVRRRVPSTNLVLGATGGTSGAVGGSAPAAKLRLALAKAPGGELLLESWARVEGLGASVAATAAHELLESNEARIVRKPEPAAARTEAGLKGGGFLPGLRVERSARLLAPADPARAGRAWVKSGWERLLAGRILEAVEAFQQALALDAGAASPSDFGLAAREGLLSAFEVEATEGRRLGLEPRSPAEGRKIASELGKAYLAVGAFSRARVCLERGLDEGAPVEAHLEVLRALIGAGQIGRALERTEALAKALDPSTKRDLVLSIVKAGAKGPSYDRALAIVGGRGEQQVAALGLAAAGLATVIALGAFFQGAALGAIAEAAEAVRPSLAAQGPLPDQAARFAAIASRYSFVPAGGRARSIADHLEGLAADAELLKRESAALRWRKAEDPQAAKRQLAALVAAARTDSVKRGVLAAQAGFDKWQRELAVEIGGLRDDAREGRAESAVERARRLVERFPTWRSEWKDLAVPVRVVPTPLDAVVEWNGERVAGEAPTLLIPMEPGSGTLRVRGSTPGWLAVEQRVSLADTPPVIVVNLQKDASAASVVRRPTPAPTPTPVPVTPTRAPEKAPATPTPAATPRPKIRIKGDDAPPPQPTSPTAGEAPSPEKRSSFTVVDIDGAEIQKALGGSPIEVQPTPGYFDFLKRDLPERFLLTVRIETHVRERKIFLEGVTLKLVDNVLGKAIRDGYCELDPACERPLQGLEGGRRAVLPLPRTVHFSPDVQESWKELVRDKLKTMVSDFMRGESGR